MWASIAAAVESRPKPTDTPAASLSGQGFEVRVEPCGSLELTVAGETFTIDSTFSYPGDKIGYNGLARRSQASQHADWRPHATAESRRCATVTANCPYYALHRRIIVEGHAVHIQDTITGTGGEAVGVLVEHRAEASSSLRNHLFGGVPVPRMDPDVAYGHGAGDNPTAFLETPRANLGILAEDNVLRRHFTAIAEERGVRLRSEHFGVDVGKSYTFEWTLYPLPRESDYWAFINQVRKDWKIGYTIEGPWGFFDVHGMAALIDDPDKLRTYLQRKNLKIVALMPWLDYDNFNRTTNQLVTRAEYRETMAKAIKAFREVDPSILLTGCIESFPVPLSLEDSRRIFDRLPAEQRAKQGYYWIPSEWLGIIEDLDPQRLKSVRRDPQGQCKVELYFRGEPPKPLCALIAYPAPGNGQQAWLMDEARFMLKDVGLDGIYIDCFSLAYDWNEGGYDYSGWDGTAVEIDPATGQIAAKRIDAGLVGAKAREDLIRYALREGKVFVANTYAVAKETQSLPTFRFSESEYCFDPLKLGKGEKPPLFSMMAAGQLSSPIGLGYRPNRLGKAGEENYAKAIMKTVITYLRDGGLFYHYSTEIPETGPGSGEYGPINHMYPITPVELHEGWILGKERILTAVSGTFAWPATRKPKVLVFDITGRPTEGKVDIQQATSGWSVSVKIEDWENVAVIE